MGTMKFDESGLESAKSSLTNMKTNLAEAESNCGTLISNISHSGEWTGKSELAMLAYLDLLKKYLKPIASSGDDYALSQAIKAFEKLEESLGSFYEDFPEYKKLESL